MNTLARRIGAAVLVGITVMSATSLLTVAAAAQQPQTKTPQAPAPHDRARIGTYDSRALAVAYASSEFNRKRIAGWQEELKNAQAAKDEKRVKELEARGASAQRRLHLQGFSNAPVEDILALIKDRLPQIATDAHVVAIVSPAAYCDSAAVEIVDVTDELVKLFNPSDQTLKAIAQIRMQRPVDIEAIATMDPQR